MPKITFKNTGETFDVPQGTSILECALDHNIPLTHDCGGNCACTTCQLWVEDGMKCLSSMSEDERGLLEANDKLDEKSRLGCQSRIQNGHVTVRYPE